MNFIDQELQFFILQSLGLLAIMFPAFCILSIVRNSRAFKKKGKLMWTLVVILLPIIGSFLYLSIGRDQVLNTEVRSDIR
ncbi:PLD nuclease N-terminal domain-containing protein [Zunongwangia endophytica]|uniref:PLD nuclease N-terminal domain-containing protein n=1 Tax=Zunongwangia endophytica TaxID=1808945 RepID=A0ABV8H736_9FLAO|nr:PLD nuclease N-terminal domain-containing protein [Zunongwangia endophytica]MDN3594758.1 PLD nuclease N-terminal domain-containing protein [Zunongwangia endophytica]